MAEGNLSPCDADRVTYQTCLTGAKQAIMLSKENNSKILATQQLKKIKTSTTFYNKVQLFFKIIPVYESVTRVFQYESVTRVFQYESVTRVFQYKSR